MLHKIVFYSAHILAETLPNMCTPDVRPSAHTLALLEESLVVQIFAAPYFDVRLAIL